MISHTEHELDPKAEAKTYTLTLVVLLILTAITVGASYIQFGSLNVVIALTIATIKASLVALFFMHLRHDKPVNAVIACAGFLFLGLFLLFTFLDVGTRDPLQPVNLKAPAPAAAAPAAGAPETPAATPAAPAAAPAATPAKE
jgi:cytochrome c oxidase subunit 4